MPGTWSSDLEFLSKQFSSSKNYRAQPTRLNIRCLLLRNHCSSRFGIPAATFRNALSLRQEMMHVRQKAGSRWQRVRACLSQLMKDLSNERKSNQPKTFMKIKPAKEPGHVMVELSASDSERLSKTAEKKDRAISPFKLKKILVPLDFSDCSKKALQYAIPFAKQFNARMIFLHVLPVRFATGWGVDPATYPMIEGDLWKDSET